MKFVTAHAGALHVQAASAVGSAFARDTAADIWSPGSSLAGPAVHELLFDARAAHPLPLFPAAVLARNAIATGREASGGAAPPPSAGAVVWIDAVGTLHPPGVFAAGIPPGRLYVLRVKPADVVAAAVECLRCSGVSATIANLPPRPSRVHVRRLQLAAERGGGVGVFLRDAGRGSDVYAAASRWLVAPAPGERAAQRWGLTFLHGQGGRVGERFTLEKRRDAGRAELVRPMAADLRSSPRLATGA